MCVFVCVVDVYACVFMYVNVSMCELDRAGGPMTSLR